MTFLRGAALTTATTLGFSDSADLGPTAGNGFYKRWPDDLALLQDLGVTDIRLTLDWARLQPKPGTLDPDWTERFGNILTAAEAIGLRTWATFHEASIPRWFDNEGGFDDAEAFARWWPRWVERAADQFGDRVHGWVPFATIPDDAEQPWQDTWGILEGGAPPVVASVDAATAMSTIGSYVGRMHRLGIVLPAQCDVDTDVGTDTELDTAALAETAERWGTMIREAVSEIDGEPLVLTEFAPDHPDAVTSGTIVEALVSTIDQATADGIEIEVCFIGPAIAGHDSGFALLDADRQPTPATSVYLPSAEDD